MRIMEIEASVTILQKFWVKVPDDMPDEAVRDIKTPSTLRRRSLIRQRRRIVAA